MRQITSKRIFDFTVEGKELIKYYETFLLQRRRNVIPDHKLK